jgi:hypothetical protein
MNSWYQDSSQPRRIINSGISGMEIFITSSINSDKTSLDAALANKRKVKNSCKSL